MKQVRTTKGLGKVVSLRAVANALGFNEKALRKWREQFPDNAPQRGEKGEDLDAWRSFVNAVSARAVPGAVKLDGELTQKDANLAKTLAQVEAIQMKTAREKRELIPLAAVEEFLPKLFGRTMSAISGYDAAGRLADKPATFIRKEWALFLSEVAARGQKEIEQWAKEQKK